MIIFIYVYRLLNDQNYSFVDTLHLDHFRRNHDNLSPFTIFSVSLQYLISWCSIFPWPCSVTSSAYCNLFFVILYTIWLAFFFCTCVCYTVMHLRSVRHRGVLPSKLLLIRWFCLNVNRMRLISVTFTCLGWSKDCWSASEP